jgi:hypothetical protein
MRKPGSKGAPTAANFKRAAKTAKKKKGWANKKKDWSVVNIIVQGTTTTFLWVIVMGNPLS